MISALINVPASESEWSIWSFAHALDHKEIIQAIQQQGGPALPEYQLEPLNFDEVEDFLERNTHAHNDMNGALRLNSADLQEVDFEDKQQLVSWIGIHWQEHTAARAVLRI